MEMSDHEQLSSGWVLVVPDDDSVPADLRGRSVAASVPGCVHTDLLAAGLIPDPLVGSNEALLGWIGQTDWTFRTTFDGGLGEFERADLVCEGLDTVAGLTLNGAALGETRNMHRSYRFDVTTLLQQQDNLLSIDFASAVRYAEAERDRLGDRPGPYDAPFAFIRKMACNFGWDWGPSLVTAGIWREISVHRWSTARLASVRPVVTVSPDGAGTVTVHVEVERLSADADLTLTLDVPGHGRVEHLVEQGTSTAVVSIDVPDIRLWWPRGHGEQPLYEVVVTLEVSGRELDTWRRRVGFRTVELDTTPDEAGVPFRIKVNGQLVLVRGVNWIPNDVFVTRVDRDAYAERLDDACAAGVNLVRVWGGGLYETEDFYDVADERGLLVWQDFLFACAAYPEESPLAEEVVAEAREVVVRLASHPSLALWNGNNENIWGYWDWGWQEQLQGRSWGAGYYFDVLPGIVAELDPTRPYWPGSPYSGDPAIPPNDPTRGPIHVWNVWNDVDYTSYRDVSPRFVAEFGYQAPPTMATLRRALEPADLTPYSEAMLVHQKAKDGNHKLESGLVEHFVVPESFDDWHYLTQVNQARAMQVGIEHFRSQFPWCTGTIVWQLNDCWPVVSWAAIDGDGRRKPLWYALRDAYHDRLATVQPRADGLVVAMSNDTELPWRGALTAQRRSFSGTLLATVSVLFEVEARGAAEIGLPEDLVAVGEPSSEVLVVRAGGPQAWWFFERDHALAYAPTSYDVSTAAVPGGTAVTVTARVLLRDVCLFADRLDPDAVVDRALVTLLPGESVTFNVQHDTAIEAGRLTSPPVLRCVNDILGSGAPGLGG